MRLFIFSLLAVAFSVASTSRKLPELTVEDVVNSILRSPEMRKADGRLDSIRQKALVKAIYNNATLLKQALKERKKDSDIKYTFPCKIGPTPTRKATSIHEVTPFDFSVVAAMGDSITAGSGLAAKTIIGLMNSYRGLVYSIGGDDSFETNPTIPNILRKYNPKLKGYSLGICKVNSKNAHLNIAHAGDKSDDMPYQAKRLVEMIHADRSIDQENDWKLITLFIGGNDLCATCKDEHKWSPELYTERIKSAIDILRANLNRTFVNIVGVLDVSQIKQLNIGLVCAGAHVVECRCGAYAWSSAAIRHLEQQYQAQSCQMASSSEYHDRDDFAVVFQPFFVETKLPLKNGKPDLDYFAPDCFHLSRLGHASMALSLWNNMLEPLPNKKFSWHVGEEYECPTAERPYFATWKNSGAAKCPTV